MGGTTLQFDPEAKSDPRAAVVVAQVAPGRVEAALELALRKRGLRS